MLRLDTIALAYEVLSQVTVSPRDPEAMAKMERLTSAIADLEAAARALAQEAERQSHPGDDTLGTAGAGEK